MKLVLKVDHRSQFLHASLNPDEWAALCKDCHLVVHTLMRINIRNWKTIVSILKEVDIHLEDRLSSK